MLPEEPHVLPRPEHAIDRLLAPRHRKLHELLRLLVSLLEQLIVRLRVVRERREVLLRVRVQPQRLHERRVRQRDLDSDAVYERQERRVDVVGPPPDRHRVDGDDQRAVSMRLRTGEHRQGDVVVQRPVELEPAGPVGVRLRDALERAGRGATENQGDPECTCRAGGGELPIGVHESLAPNRGDDERGGMLHPEYRRLCEYC